MWIFWALLSAVTSATRRTSEKRLTQNLHNLTISFTVQLLSLPIIIVVVLLRGDLIAPWQLGWQFWIPLTIVCIGFYPLNSFLYLQAVRSGELSKVLPIQSLWPVFSLLPAFFLLGQVPSSKAVIGIMAIVCGVYVMGLKGRRLHRPWQPFLEEKSSLYMLISVVLVTIAGVLDTIAIKAFNATYYSLISTLGAVIVLYITMRLQRVNEFKQLARLSTNLTITGSLQGMSYTTYLLALSTGPIAYVTAIRSSNVLLGSLLGILIFKERLTKAKALSFCLILLGGILLV